MRVTNEPFFIFLELSLKNVSAETLMLNITEEGDFGSKISSSNLSGFTLYPEVFLLSSDECEF